MQTRCCGPAPPVNGLMKSRAFLRGRFSSHQQQPGDVCFFPLGASVVREWRRLIAGKWYGRTTNALCEGGVYAEFCCNTWKIVSSSGIKTNMITLFSGFQIIWEFINFQVGLEITLNATNISNIVNPMLIITYFHGVVCRNSNLVVVTCWYKVCFVILNFNFTKRQNFYLSKSSNRDFFRAYKFQPLVVAGYLTTKNEFRETCI